MLSRKNLAISSLQMTPVLYSINFMYFSRAGHYRFMLRNLLFYSFFFMAPLCLRAQQKTDYRAVGAQVPPFVLQKVDGSFITNAQLKPGKPTVLMIFSPQCDHCEHMLDSMKSLASRLEKTQFVLVTEARNKDLLKDFLHKTGMDTARIFKNVGWDHSNLIYYIYTYHMLPQINIYNAKQQLVTTLAGNFPIDSLRMFLPKK